MKKLINKLIMADVISLALYLIFAVCFSSNLGTYISYSSAISKIENNMVSDVMLKKDSDVVQITTTNGEKYSTRIISISDFSQDILEKHPEIDVDLCEFFSVYDFWAEGVGITAMVMLILTGLSMVIMFLKDNIKPCINLKKDAFSNSNSEFSSELDSDKNLDSDSEDSSMRLLESHTVSSFSKTFFEDLIGIDSKIIEKLKGIVDFLKMPEKDTKGAIPKSVLIIGPQKSGKKEIANAIAGEANVQIFKVEKEYWDSGNLNVVSDLQEFLKNAERRFPCIVLLEEIDRIFIKERNNKDFVKEISDVISSFMQKNCVVFATASHENLLRRKLVNGFDYCVRTNYPDEKMREEYLVLNVEYDKVDKSISFKEISKRTEEFSFEDLKRVIEDAEELAEERGSTVLKQKDFDKALQRILHCKEYRKNKKYYYAVHEAGHAIVQMVAGPYDCIQEISIIGELVDEEERGGYNLYCQENPLWYKDEIFASIVGLYGGRVAEEIISNVESIGAYADLKVASEKAYEMVNQYALSDSLLTIIEDSTFDVKLISSRLQKAEEICQSAYKRAVEIITVYQEETKKLADEIFKKEILTAYEIENFMSENDINSET